MADLVLSLFPGLGLLDKAFELEGYCVVRGPDVLWGGDVRSFKPPTGKFDGIIGGPPCQAFSKLVHIVRANGYEPKFGNLIPEFERVVSEAKPRWFIMENVPDAPTPIVEGYDVYSLMLNNRQCMAEDGEAAKQNRVRRISWGWRGTDRPPLCIDICLWENQQYEYAATGGSSGREIPLKLGGTGKVKKSAGKSLQFNSKTKSAVEELLRKQGLPEGFIEHSPFTVTALCKMLGNGVPLPMGRAIARAVKEAVESRSESWIRQVGG
jgi:DNA (cytosine-5)-methyltransferase 1